ncbi:MAG: ABC transporter permease [Candidatus Heimdallarchaeota archaeon]|nr:ABC transporter permease [Candidatus Heimdallarchaeota archaeon]MCK5048073.1 ABC transporter permease [Candidatus Heimdallarchaeota archaeon]
MATGNFRVFLKNIRYTFRNKKRFTFFIILFIFLSGGVTFFVDTFTEYNRSELLEHKGILIKQQDFDTVDWDTSSPTNFANNLILDISALDNVQGVFPLSYVDIGPSLRFYGIDHSHPWVYDLISPLNVLSGTFLESSSDMIIPKDSSFRLNLSDTAPDELSIILSPGVDDTFTFNFGSNSIGLKVAGIYDPINLPTGDRTSLFVDQTILDQLIDDIPGLVRYIYQISVIVSGPGSSIFGFDSSVLYDETYDNRIVLKDEIDVLFAAEAQLSVIFDAESPKILGDITTIKQNKDRDVITFIIGITMGLFVSVIYAYLMSRFRKDEIAVLKALGYSSRHIRIALLAEIMTISMLGFAIGTSIIQWYLLRITEASVLAVFDWNVIIATFVIVVIIDIPGTLFASRRMMKVTPLDVFRDR